MRFLWRPLILALCLESVWAVGDAAANTAGEPCSNSTAPLTLSSQAEVDALGATGCTRTHGGLKIQGDDITNVDALENITRVGSALTIFWNPLLTDLDGLSNLAQIGTGEIRIEKNASLVSTSGLRNLKGNAYSDGVIHGLIIKDNPQLQKIDGLSQITELEGQLSIGDNPVLTDLSGLENLEVVAGQLQIMRNDALSNLDDMSNLARASNVWIARNAALENIDFLGQLDGVRYLTIENNPALQDLDGALTLNRSGAALHGGPRIYENESLTDCRGLARLVGWPGGLPSRHFKDITLNSNKLGCNSLEEVLGSVNGPSEPVIENGAVANDRVSLKFAHAQLGDAIFAARGYKASCLTASAYAVDMPELDIVRGETISRSLNVQGFTPIAGPDVDIEITLDLEHEDLDELEISVTSPAGTVLLLWDEQEASGNSLIGTFPKSLTPVSPFSGLQDEDLNGDWILTIRPPAFGSRYGGLFLYWDVKLTQGVSATVQSSPAELNGLSRGAEYECTLAPLSELGEVPSSDPYLLSGPYEPPATPTITSTDYEDGKIILTVSVSDNGGTDITGYEATCTDGTNTYTGTSTSSPITVSGLTNGVSYTCSVTATNSVSTSAASASTAPIIPGPKPPRVVLEEPVRDETHTGVGNLRGWAISSDGIEKVEVHIDGSYAFDAPYGGERTDVRDAFPDVEGSADSGFSLAFNYSNLSSGLHTISAVAHSGAGATKESTADFEVVRFDSSFISDPNAVDLSDGSCLLASDEVTLSNVTVDGSQHDLVMKWRRAEQGFELIQIDKSDDKTAEAAPVALSAQQSNFVAQSDPVLRVVLEEPVSEEIHTGVGNLRGWAVADEGIEKVEIYIDGAYSFNAPYGGVRTDVRDAFPDVEGSADSGFSLAFNYSNLSAGGHTIKAIAYDRLGATKESSAEFTVVRFDSSFIIDLNAVDLSEGSCSLGTDEVSLTDVTVDGSLHDLVMKWRTAEQGFEIVEIR